jgi:hypothetical protein
VGGAIVGAWVGAIVGGDVGVGATVGVAATGVGVAGIGVGRNAVVGVACWLGVGPSATHPANTEETTIATAITRVTARPSYAGDLTTGIVTLARRA